MLKVLLDVSEECSRPRFYCPLGVHVWRAKTGLSLYYPLGIFVWRSKINLSLYSESSPTSFKLELFESYLSVSRVLSLKGLIVIYINFFMRKATLIFILFSLYFLLRSLYKASLWLFWYFNFRWNEEAITFIIVTKGLPKM